MLRQEEGPGAEPADGLAREAELSFTVARWLFGRGHRDPALVKRWCSPRLVDLTRPDEMADRAVAARRIALAVRRGERIAVYGDYDCDGMTSTALLTSALLELGAQVVPLLASRFDGGYGVTPRAAARIRESEATLLVTCDCGSSDHAVLAELGRAGVESVVIDHHLVPEEPLPVVAFLNPHRPECGFPYKGLASVGLALSVVGAVRRELERELDLRRYLDLVAIGTIADVAPLDGDNRALVRAGLERLAVTERPGLAALLVRAKLDEGRVLTGGDVAFRVAPRLNAPGRLGAPTPALELLLARDGATAEELAQEVERIADLRRERTRALQAEAEELIRELDPGGRAALVLWQEGWSTGLVGIAAGRLAEQWKRPVVVIGVEGGVGRGSVRGPRGARLHDALAATADVLVRFGGHQAAAGLEVEAHRLEEFRARFEAACAELGGGEVADEELGAWLDPRDDPHQVLRDLAALEPCGERNPLPELLVEAEVLRAREVTGGHLKLELRLSQGQRLGGFGPGLGAHAAELGKTVRLAGRLQRDEWRGGEAVELRIARVL